MSMRLGMSVAQHLEERLVLANFFGETSGDIPLLSLHRIKSALRRDPIEASPQVRTMVLRALIRANAAYKKESGNNWSCLTANNLDEAIASVDSALSQGIEDASEVPKEHAAAVERIKKALHVKRVSQISTIKAWFAERFDGIAYIMDGKIPWAVVCRLRKNLARWVVEETNPFSQNIEEMILSVAAENGIHTDDPENAWEAMGGKIFTKKEKE